MLENNLQCIMGRRSFFLQTLVPPFRSGKAFEGTIDYQLTDDQLRACSGNTDLTSLTQFRPVQDFPHARMAYKLLMALQAYNLCCFLTGTYVMVVGGQLDFFDGMSIIIALNDF